MKPLETERLIRRETRGKGDGVPDTKGGRDPGRPRVGRDLRKRNYWTSQRYRCSLTKLGF